MFECLLVVVILIVLFVVFVSCCVLLLLGFWLCVCVEVVCFDVFGFLLLVLVGFVFVYL